MTQTALTGSANEAPEALLERLLVAYDSSAASESAVQYAISLAQSFHSFTTIVYIQPPTEVAEDMASGFAQMRESHKQLSLDLQSVAARLNKTGIQNRVLYRAGAAGDVLVQLAAEFGTDLLLLGAHGHRRIDRPRLGSTAEFMLRSMPCAVLTVGPGAVLYARDQPAMRTFLYASSLPLKIGRASHFVKALAKNSRAHVEIIHVIGGQPESHDARTPAELRGQEDALAKQLRETGVDVTWRLSHGLQDQLILERARAIHADLIVFGLEHPAVDPESMGTISTVIQQAPCPVLTVPGPA